MMVKPGDEVEWCPLYAHGTMRGVVTRIEPNGTVFLRIRRYNKRNEAKDSEVWFERGEAHRLRVVTP